MSSNGIVNISISTLTFVNDAVGPFLPFLNLITSLTKEISDAYENVQYNKKTCGILVGRVEAAEVAIKGLIRQKEENVDNFRSQDYFDSFEKFVICLENIKEFFYDISQLSKIRKFLTSGKIKEKFQVIIKEFDSYSVHLNLAISVTTSEQMNKYLSLLQSDTIEMKKFMENVEGGITSVNDSVGEVIDGTAKLQIQNEIIISNTNKIIKILDRSKTLDFAPLNAEIETIYTLNKGVNNQNSSVKAKRIDPLELKDPPQRVVRDGSRVKIQKKVYNAFDVACKPITIDVEKVQKHLAILEKLNCPYVIQFYGLSEIAKQNVMVFEWAQYGTLRELYCKFEKIAWNAKISIARDICRGLAYLHSVNILHHDLKCESILITENLQPKISNFGFAREFEAKTCPIEEFNEVIYWLAPEKLKFVASNILSSDSKPDEVKEVRYTIQCEIFSFGMLLWELAYQKKPYENIPSIMDVVNHVINGGRETLDVGSQIIPIQRKYHSIIELAWEQEPSLRPGIQHLFNMLQELYEDPSENSELDSTPLTPLDEGIRADKAHNYEKAWKCFGELANIGEMSAKYWQGLYYLKGKFVTRDFTKAKELFKESADGGNADAQLSYAFCLISKENDCLDFDNFLKYLKMSADKDNADALYNLGDLYFFGYRDTIGKDRIKGVYYLKRAALKNEPRSMKILDYHDITYYGTPSSENVSTKKQNVSVFKGIYYTILHTIRTTVKKS